MDCVKEQIGSRFETEGYSRQKRVKIVYGSGKKLKTKEEVN